MDKESHAALMLQLFSSFSASDIIKLYRKTDSFADIFNIFEKLDEVSDALQKNLSLLDNRHTELAVRAESVLSWCSENQVAVISLGSAQYPSLLADISNPPALLFVQGDASQLCFPQLAIVGSRSATVSGQKTAFDFAKALTTYGFTITSGLALGIDAAAHAGALESSFSGGSHFSSPKSLGKTIAVLGAGIDIQYPRQHAELQQKILEAGGAVVTEFLPGTPPKPGNFPRRNRIISGLSLGTIVVEAALKSGSLITARYAMEQGREVFAMPGSIHNILSKGTHALLKQGATLVESASDIVAELGGMLGYMDAELIQHEQSKPSDSVNGSNAGLAATLEAIGFDPVDIDTLIERTGLAITELSQQLIQLELDGFITGKNGWYDRIK